MQNYLLCKVLIGQIGPVESELSIVFNSLISCYKLVIISTMSGFLDNAEPGAALKSLSSTVDGKFEFMGGMDAGGDVKNSRWCVLVRRPGEICCGVIRTAGKFSAVPKGKCSVSSHAQK